MDDEGTSQPQATVTHLAPCSRCGHPIVDGHFVLSLKDGMAWHTHCEPVSAPPPDGSP